MGNNMNLQLTTKFSANLEDIDAIFSTSQTLKDLYQGEIERLIKEELKAVQNQQLKTLKKALGNIGCASIEQTERKNWASDLSPKKWTRS